MSFLRSTIEIAGSEPTVDLHGLGGLRIVQVTGEDVVPAQHHLADLADAEKLDVVLDLGLGDGRVSAPDRPPDGAGLAAVHLLVEGGHR